MTYKIQIDGVVREATADEAAVIELIQQEAADEAQAQADKIAARASALAKLSKIGLTDVEIEALVG